jgi:hypothetical protein
VGSYLHGATGTADRGDLSTKRRETMNEKPFLLFAGSDYYPSGGWNDYRSAHATEEAAAMAAQDLMKYGCDWWQVVDVRTLQEVTGYGS